MEEGAARLTDTGSAINLPFARSRYLSVLRDQPRHRRLREKPGGPPSLGNRRSRYKLEQPRQSRLGTRAYTRVDPSSPPSSFHPGRCAHEPLLDGGWKENRSDERLLQALVDERWKGGGIAASIRRAIISVLGGYGSITVRMVAHDRCPFRKAKLPLCIIAS